MVQFYWQSREPELIYAIQHTIPFQGDKETLAVQNITFQNDGAQQAENIVAEIRIDGAKIKEKKITADPSFTYKEKVGKDSYRLEARSLNPKEKVELSLLLSSNALQEKPVKVFFRGDGATGKDVSTTVSDKKDTKISLSLGAALAAVYLVMVVLAITNKRYRFLATRILKTGKLFNMGEQHQHIGSLFALHGAYEEAEHYIVNRNDCSYWSESDLLTAKAIASGDRSKAEIFIKVLSDLVSTDFRIQLSSQAVIHYNVARLYQFLGDAGKAETSLSLAKEIDADMVTKRMSRDFIFSSFPPA